MRRWLDRLYDGAGALGAFCVFLIFVLMIVAGVGRQMNWHVSGINDVVAWLCAAAAFFAMAHAFRHGDFVRVTLLLDSVPPEGAARARRHLPADRRGRGGLPHLLGHQLHLGELRVRRDGDRPAW